MINGWAWNWVKSKGTKIMRSSSHSEREKRVMGYWIWKSQFLDKMSCKKIWLFVRLCRVLFWVLLSCFIVNCSHHMHVLISSSTLYSMSYCFKATFTISFIITPQDVCKWKILVNYWWWCSSIPLLPHFYKSLSAIDDKFLTSSWRKFLISVLCLYGVWR